MAGEPSRCRSAGSKLAMRAAMAAWAAAMSTALAVAAAIPFSSRRRTCSLCQLMTWHQTMAMMRWPTCLEMAMAAVTQTRLNDQRRVYIVAPENGVRTACIASMVADIFDIVHLILSHVDVDPPTFVRIGRVSKTWREAIRTDASLLLRSAHAQRYLTKTTFMGLFGLSSEEANQFPRQVEQWKGRVIFKYGGVAIDMVMEAIGGMGWWRV